VSPQLGAQPQSRVVVVGGGLAGITAALDLADAGHAVTLLEGRPRLGGATHSFRRAELGGIDVDNGQHVFLRCCTDYRGLLQRLGVEHLTTLQPRLDIPVVEPARGRTGRLTRSNLPAPLHLAPALLRYRMLSPAQRVSAARAALALGKVDPTDPAVDARSFGDWLTSRRQSPQAVAALWELVTVATLNARADRASLALAATVFQIGLLESPDNGDIGYAAVPLQRLHGDAATSALEAAGVAVYLRRRVTGIGLGGAGWVVGTDAGPVEADGVVLAVPSDSVADLAPAGALPDPEALRRLGSSPIVNVHVVYDRPVMDAPFVAGVGTPVQWAFDRTAASGLDPATGQYVAVSVSAADDWIGRPAAQVREAFEPALQQMFPRAREARVLSFLVTRERAATFRQAPGSAALRPGPATALPGLYLAGAWTATGWPATMEGAVRSGHAAARAHLAAQRRREPARVAS